MTKLYRSARDLYKKSMAARVVVRLAATIVVLVGLVRLSVHTPPAVTDWFNGFAEVGLYCIAIPAGAFFVVFLTGFTHWRSTPAGESVVALGLALELVLIVNALSLLLGVDYPGREYVRTLSYWGLGAAMVYLSYTAVQLNVSDLIKRRADALQQGSDEPVSR